MKVFLEASLARVIVDRARFVRYCLVGLLTLGIFCALTGLASLFPSLPPAVATAIAVLAAGAFNFVGHHAFTYHSARATRSSLPRYVVLLIANAALGAGIVAVGTAWAGLSAGVANAVSVAAIMLSTYVILARVVM